MGPSDAQNPDGMRHRGFLVFLVCPLKPACCGNAILPQGQGAEEERGGVAAPRRTSDDEGNAEIAAKARSYLGTFSQSSRNFLIPASVSGCLASCMITEKGMVAMSAPIRALFRTWIGLRTLATIISAS